MIFKKYLLFIAFTFVFVFVNVQNSFAQCIQIESILVDACGGQEGLNEMVRFKVGATAINTSSLDVNWPNNNWEGLVQNGITATKTADLNADILDAGGCGQLIEPTGGVLPANANVILVTSFNLDTALNSFGALTEDIYILYQDNATTTGGHFANSGTGTRTLSISFNACTDSVTYNRALLINSSGATTAGDGAIVTFDPSGNATYINNGCSAPVQPFTVDAGAPSVNSCAGGTVSLTGTAQGQQTVLWSAASGSFSDEAALSTDYTLDPAATGTITLTLTVTNSCGLVITDTIDIVVNNITPTFNSVPAICFGNPISPLPTTSINGILGTWTPALNNNATTTYTFTPNVGQCASSTTLTITVNTVVAPTFNAVPAICLGDVLSPLPTTSTNGITGSWSPALNNGATTIYTFTPSTGQCASTTTLTIAVNTPGIVPTFAAVPDICSGETIAALPTTSTNGILGTWTPALNNTATTTYTFTPNTGQCATTATLSITVNTPVLPTFNSIPAICSGDTLSPLPTTSINGITGSWAPALNNAATTVYTFTPTAGQCASVATLTIAVNTPSTLPGFVAVPAICFGDTLSALPTTSTNGITGSWTPALNNTATTTYTFTPDAGQCALNAALTITVNPLLTPAFNAVSTICIGDTLSPLPTTSTNGIVGSWSPALNNNATTTYTFTPDAGQCASAATLEIAVNTLQTPTFNAVPAICSGETLLPLPTTSTNGIAGNWTPALDNLATTTYTFTPNAGQCALPTTLTITVNTPTTVPVFNGVPAICSGDTLLPLPLTSTNGITGSWAPALNNTSTTTYTFTPNISECALTTTLTITVNTLQTPTFNAVPAICSGDALSALPTTSLNGITGSWAPALNNAATTVYTFTPDAGQCASNATLTITVTPANTVPTFSAVPAICSGDALSALPTTSLNGITGSWAPALNNAATTTYTFSPDAGQCALTTTLTISVNSLLTPAFNAVTPICSGDNLSPLPTTSTNGIIGSWSPALNNTATTTYTFTPDSGQCASPVTLVITVNNLVTPDFPATLVLCNGETAPTLQATSANGISGSWSPSIIDATADGIYTFTPSIGQCAASVTTTVTVSQINFDVSEGCVNREYLLQVSPLAGSTDLDQADYLWKDGIGTVVSTQNTLNVTELVGDQPNVQFPLDYTLTITNQDGCTVNRSFTVAGIFCSIPKGISPNNDDKNDEFDLTGMGVKDITIFNRYGTEVFHYKNYTDQFKGLSNDGKTLPDATYFYVIEDNGGQTFTGWVYINR
ncbi:gliding motility-associated C-terminal domain-containing protein [Flavobacterium sp.]|uniref:gliding motility-associated C-terminal domain-containing protein n=1 Tax=Flavobacterium sp. TaxID=239 RepID=UPI002609B9A3|nr:gliding motility-associated C-terminal domain-containing protein [Flavobacterium sp.]